MTLDATLYPIMRYYTPIVNSGQGIYSNPQKHSQLYKERFEIHVKESTHWIVFSG